MYKASIFGSTPPVDLWAAFKGVAQIWNLDDAQQQRLLGTTPQNPNSTLVPTLDTARRIEYIKDCALHLNLYHTKSGRSPGEWVRRPMPIFNQRSPLEVMSLEPAQIRSEIPSPTIANLDKYWTLPNPAPSLGAEIVRGLLSWASPAQHSMIVSPALAAAKTYRLVQLGRRSAQP